MRVTRYGYDENGRRNYVRSPRGLETTTEYDAAGRATATIQRADGRQIREERGYGRSGRTRWTQTPLQAGAGLYSTYLYETTVAVGDPRYGQLLQVFHEDTNDVEVVADATRTERGQDSWTSVLLVKQ